MTPETRRRTTIGAAVVAVLAATAGWTSIDPSHERSWAPEQRLLPRATFDGEIVTVDNVRNFRWAEGGGGAQAWETRTYDLAEIATVWYILTPFATDRRGPAHAFVSFGFDDGQYLAVSVEARREEGEAYSIAGGMLKQYEIMYVAGDERDLIDLRVRRGDDVYVYPIRATREQVRALFTAMLTRANDLHDRPEFYGTLRNNCTTNLLDHVNTLVSEPIHYGRRILLPGYSDEVAHERGLIDTELSLEAARARFRINDRAAHTHDDVDYSLEIREPIP